VCPSSPGRSVEDPAGKKKGKAIERLPALTTGKHNFSITAAGSDKEASLYERLDRKIHRTVPPLSQTRAFSLNRYESLQVYHPASEQLIMRRR